MKKFRQSQGHYKLRSVESTKVGLLPIATKEMMREVVTDYIIHQSKTHACYKIRRPKYEPLRVKLHANNKQEIFSFDIFLVLERFIAMEKQNLDSQVNIEFIILAILQFIDQLTEQEPIRLDMQSATTPDSVLATLLANYFRERQRRYFQNQYLEMRLRKNGRSKLLSPKQLSNGHSEENSQRVSRTTIAFEKQKSKKRFKPFTKSKLKNLVDSCNIFDFPDRVEALKREKLIGEYCKDATDFVSMKESSKKEYPCQANSSLSPETTKLIEEWINDISLSEKLFRNKFGPSKDGRNNEIESASSEESEQQG